MERLGRTRVRDKRENRRTYPASPRASPRTRRRRNMRGKALRDLSASINSLSSSFTVVVPVFERELKPDEVFLYSESRNWMLDEHATVQCEHTETVLYDMDQETWV